MQAKQRREVGRGSRIERGYGQTHRKARERLRTGLPAPCGYGCGRVLEPDDKWVAAHWIDGDPTAGWLASCLSCNELAKTKKAPSAR